MSDKPRSSPDLVHIGYHKTATTWLQHEVFSKRPFHLGWDSMTIARSIVLPSDLEWTPSRAAEDLNVTHASHADIEVMSWERMSGSAHAGGFDSATIARRIHRLYPDTSVLIGVREQRSMIKALYKQYVRDGGIASFHGYVRPRNPSEIPQFSLAHLKYDRLVALYGELFGADRVLVYLYEELAEDQDRVVRQICEHVGASMTGCASSEERNASLGTGTLGLKRLFNMAFVRSSLSPGAPLYVKEHEALFARIDRWAPRWIQRQPLWDHHVEELVRGVFEESNHRLRDMTGLPLERFGYAVG